MNEMQVVDRGGMVNFEDFAMPASRVLAQVKLIQDVMHQTMKDGEHYGVIPGTKKPTLYKPGAEKLCLTFRMSQDYQVLQQIQQPDLISYTVRCILTHIPTGQIISSGMGACNTREEKYRWEYKLTPTEEAVPKAYWEAKKAGNNQEMKRMIGDGRRPMKSEETGQWVIATAEKVENTNAWDYDNTVLKMACKRALTAAVLNGTAASDIFTQDVEDDDGRRQEAEAAEEQGLKRPAAKTSEPEIKDPGAPASEAQLKAINAILTKLGIKDDLSRHEKVSNILEKDETLTTMSVLTKGEASKVIEALGREK